MLDTELSDIAQTSCAAVRMDFLANDTEETRMTTTRRNTTARVRAQRVAQQDLRDDPQGWSTEEIDGAGPSYDELLDQLKEEGFNVD